MGELCLNGGMTSCPVWCTAHNDPSWDAGTHYSDPIPARVRVPAGEGWEDHSLQVALCGEGEETWLEIAPQDSGGPTVILDAEGAEKLVGAIDRLLVSART